MCNPKGNTHTLFPDLGITVEEGGERLYMTEMIRKHYLPDTAGHCIHELTTM